MKLNFNKKNYFLIYTFLTILSILLGILLWSKSGLMQDSFHYLRGAEAFVNQGRYLSMDGQPQIIFPPAYSIFIAVFYLIFGNLIVSAKIVSLMASTICVCLVFRLGRKLFNDKVAILGAVLILLLPLRVFSSLWVFSEAIYVMWIYLAFSFLIRDKYSAYSCVIIGICLGLAYLTRPEAVFYFVLFIGYIFFQKANFKQKIVDTSLVFIPFFLCVASYVLYLHSVTGAWSWSGKTGTLVLGIYRGRGIPEEIIRGMDFTFSVSLLEMGKHFLRNLLNLKKNLLYILGIAPFAQFLLVFGFSGMLFSIKKKMKLTILQILFVCILFVYSFFWVERRFLLQVMPIFCLWCSNGLVEFYDWSKEKMRNCGINNAKRFSFTLSVTFCAILIVSHSFRILTVEKLTSYRPGKAIKILTEWINQNQIEKQSIYSNYIDVAYFTGMNHFWIATGSLENIHKTMKNRNIKYLIFTSKDFMFSALELLKSENNLEVNKYFKLIKKIIVDKEIAWFYEIL